MAVGDAIRSLAPLNIDTDDGVNFPGADCVLMRVLAQNVAESITIPNAAGTNLKPRIVRIATSCNVLVSGNITALAAADNAVGDAPELIPSALAERWYKLDSAMTALSFITGDAAGGIVTASFYRD